MALILIFLALLGFGFFAVGTDSGSTGSGTKHYKPQRAHPPHHMPCKARAGTGQSRRDDCGGPPANP